MSKLDDIISGAVPQDADLKEAFTDVQTRLDAINVRLDAIPAGGNGPAITVKPLSEAKAILGPVLFAAFDNLGKGLIAQGESGILALDLTK